MAAVEALPRYRQDGYFAAWLFSIARKKVADFHRRVPQVPLDASTLPPIHTDLAGDVETSQRRERLLNLIQALAEEERELIQLRYVAELSFAAMPERFKGMTRL